VCNATLSYVRSLLHLAENRRSYKPPVQLQAQSKTIISIGNVNVSLTFKPTSCSLVNIISTKNVYSAMLKKRLYTLNRGKQHFKIIKNDIKITMFQYKIIHNILPTKVSLFKAKITDNDICPQCLTNIKYMEIFCNLL